MLSTFALVTCMLAGGPAPGVAGERDAPVFPDWERLPPHVSAPHLEHPGLQTLLSRRTEALRELEAYAGGDWIVTWNEETLVPRRITGGPFPLVAMPTADDPDGVPPRSSSGDSSTEEIPVDVLSSAARGFLARFPAVFPVDVEHELEPARVRRLARSSVLRFRQTFAGRAVWGARIDVLVDRAGRLVDVRSDLIPRRLLALLESDLAGEPALDEAAATSAALRALGIDALAANVTPSARLWIMPLRVGRNALTTARERGRIAPVLAWEIRLPPEADGTLSSWSVFVAATSRDASAAGAVLGRIDHTSRDSVRGRALGAASPGLFPDTEWNEPQRAPLANLDVRADEIVLRTDELGWFDVEHEPGAELEVSATLDGPYCRVESEGSPRLSASSSVVAGAPLDLRFNEPWDEHGTAQVNAFIHVNRAHDVLAGIAPEFTEIDVPVVARVNLRTHACNGAFFREGEGVLGFFRSDPCVNTAYSTWVYHEYAHFVLWKAFDGEPIMPAYDEGMADGFVALLTGQPFVGHAIDGQSASRDLSLNDRLYPANLLDEPHEAGHMLGHALWRLRELLDERYADLPGRAADVLGRLWLDSALLAPPVISPDLVLDFLLVDDDDAVLANGTPHFTEIVTSFDEIGLPCPGRLEILHEPLADTADTGPRTIRARTTSTFAFGKPTIVAANYSSDGGRSYRAVLLEYDETSGEHVGAIPGHAEGTTVRYYLSAKAGPGLAATLPANTPAELSFVYAVADVRVVFPDGGGDGDIAGWAHGVIGNSAETDDWDWGAPGPAVARDGDLVFGDFVDPDAPFTEPGHWGTDLSIGGDSDKLYEDLARSFLLSPAIDCTGHFGVHLRFRRWLSAEKRDRLTVSVNGEELFRSSDTSDTVDTRWSLVDLDISSVADDAREVRIEFGLDADGYGRAGGWNIDDLELVSTRRTPLTTPVVMGISPRFDRLEGGSPFVLRGANFTTDGPDPTWVIFGGLAAENVNVESSTTITGTVPARRSPGSVPIVVVASSGDQATLADGFSYFDAPRLDSITPSRGRVGDVPAISIRGEFFTPDGTTEAWLGGTPVADLTVLDSTLAIGLAPAGLAPGPATLRVRTLYGESIAGGLFRYTAPPRVDSILPSSGLLESRAVFSIVGDHFSTVAGQTRVLLGESPATDVIVLSEQTLLARAPVASAGGAVDVRVVTPDGSGVLAAGFRFVDPQRQDFLRGDANLDGALDIADAVTILGTLFLGTKTLDCRDAADVNDDGTLDTSDVLSLLRFLFNDGPAPRAPWPTPGSDLTGDDALDCRIGAR